MSDIVKRIDADTIVAMKAGEKFKTTVLRGLKSDIKNIQINAGTRGTELTDEQVIAVLSTCAKKRRESIEQYRAAGRQDLVDNEAQELTIIEGYLPPQMPAEEIRKIIREAASAKALSGPTAMGALMKEIMPKLKGRADGRIINEIAKEILAG